MCFLLYKKNQTNDFDKSLIRGNKYVFNCSDNSNTNYIFKLSENEDGTHTGGTDYTTDITYSIGGEEGDVQRQGDGARDGASLEGQSPPEKVHAAQR